MAASLPNSCGVSLKNQYFDDVLRVKPDIGWFEIHPENYMSAGGLDHKYLTEITKHYPLSMHGVGMSLGSPDGMNDRHLKELKKLIERYEPAQVSEHLSWSHNAGNYFNDLLPVALTSSAFKTVKENIDYVQEKLGRTILIENPSTYIAFNEQDFSEPDFLNALADETGCGLLLDINNIYVSAINHDFSPLDYLAKIKADKVGEVHLAGHKLTALSCGKTVLIDDHGSQVVDDVWALYSHFITSLNKPLPTLIEWDTDIPELTVLLSEAAKAQNILDAVLSERLKTHV